MTERIIVERTGHPLQCTCAYCDSGNGGPRGEFYTCQGCGHRWSGELVWMVGPTGECAWDFIPPAWCPACGEPDDAEPPRFRVLPDELVANLEAAPYRYARTYPNIPHYYTLERDWADYKDGASEKFRWTVREMRKQEVVRPFMNRDQHYLDVNGFQYWTMGSRDEETILINRQYSTRGAYDLWLNAQSYDDTGESWQSVKAWREALYAPAMPAGRVLDIGCGTGLLVDYCYRDIDRSRYVGIDPNAGMLAQFALKHPDYQAEATLLRTTFEDYETPLRFDTIVAMAGSASWVWGVNIAAKARRLLAPGGRAYLTFNRDTPSLRSRRGDYVVLEFTRESDRVRSG